jgi:hypothetical protein
VFPESYELNFYILFRINSVFEREGRAGTAWEPSKPDPLPPNIVWLTTSLLSFSSLSLCLSLSLSLFLESLKG